MESIVTNLVTNLSLSLQGNDTIVVFICRLTRMARFVPTEKSINAKMYVSLFVDHVVRLHGIYLDILYDKDPKFTSNFWLCFANLQIDLNMSKILHLKLMVP